MDAGRRRLRVVGVDAQVHIVAYFGDLGTGRRGR